MVGVDESAGINHEILQAHYHRVALVVDVVGVGAARIRVGGRQDPRAVGDGRCPADYQMGAAIAHRDTAGGICRSGEEPEGGAAAGEVEVARNLDVGTVGLLEAAKVNFRRSGDLHVAGDADSPRYRVGGVGSRPREGAGIGAGGVDGEDGAVPDEERAGLGRGGDQHLGTALVDCDGIGECRHAGGIPVAG